MTFCNPPTYDFVRCEEREHEQRMKANSPTGPEPYRVNQVDLAGNDFQIFRAATFALACEQLLTVKKMCPDSLFYIINSDCADVDSDGLTDEERELLR